MPFGERVERPASEENSILSCSYAVVNHQAGMSNAFCYLVNKRAVICLFVVSTFPQPRSSSSVSAFTTFPRMPLDTPAPHSFPQLRMCLNLLIFSSWCKMSVERVITGFLFQSRKSSLHPLNTSRLVVALHYGLPRMLSLAKCEVCLLCDGLLPVRMQVVATWRL